MRNPIIYFVLLVGSTITLNSCESTNNAEICADKFFAHIVDQQYDTALQMLDVGLLNQVDHEGALEGISVHPKMGKLLESKKSIGFNTSIANGVTTVELPYTLTYEKGTHKCEVVIVNRGNGFKISAIN